MIQTFAQVLQEEMDAQGLSNRELARRLAKDPEKLNGTRRQVIRWLNGETPNPTRPTRIRIAQALKIDPARLLQALPLADVVEARVSSLEQRLGAIEGTLEALEADLQRLLGDPPPPRGTPL